MQLAIGLMSGTSADGIDVAALRTDGESQIEPMGGITLPYDTELQRELIGWAASELEWGALREATLQLERRLTELHCEAVVECCQQLGIDRPSVDVVGFHGHTLRHQPELGRTWQLGDGAALAQLLDTPVVFDLRQADMRSGGQGAPLAPLFHAAILATQPHAQLVINLGGVANITWIGADGTILAGDTGPGCGLLDQLAQSVLSQPYDRDGQLAASGEVNAVIVEQSLKLPYFERPFPKSADRYQFDEIDVTALNDADAAATLCAITVSAIERSVQRLPERPAACWVTGGGRHHPVLMKMLGEALTDVRPLSEAGWDVDLIEAQCFAWLAVRHLKGLPTSIPGTTGVAHPVCGGVLTQPA